MLNKNLKYILIVIITLTCIGFILIFKSKLSFLPSTQWVIDSDNDGLSDAEEIIQKTSPNNADTDGDGLTDKFELDSGFNPLKRDSNNNDKLDSKEDADKDGLTNLEEQQYSTNPNLADTDDDGLSDYEEVKKYNTNPNKRDTDDDGINDSIEIILGTNPNNKDSNNNGINDGDEKYEVTLNSGSVKKSQFIEVNIKGNIIGKNIENLYAQDISEHEYVNKDTKGYTDSVFKIGNKSENIENIEVTFILSSEIIKQYSGDEFALYKYDKEKQVLEIIGDAKKLVYDKNSKYEFKDTISIGKEEYEYVILNKTKWEKEEQK
jgi:hypothetical protein